MFGSEVGEELFAQGTEATFDLAAALGLIRARVNDQGTKRGGNPRQLRRAIDLRIVDVETNGDAAGGNSVAQTVERGIESLADIELRMWDEPAGVIERGVEKNLHAAATRPLHPGAEQHIGLPDLIAELGFKLLVRLWRQQLPFREAPLFEEAIQRGGRDGGRVLARRQGQFAQQGRAGAMRVLALEAFNEAGQLRCDGAGLTAVLARFGSQRFEATVAIAHGPVQ